MVTSRSKSRRAKTRARNAHPRKPVVAKRVASRTHVSAFRIAHSLSEYGVILGEEAIPRVLDHSLGHDAPFTDSIDTHSTDTALPESTVAAIGAALFAMLRPRTRVPTGNTNESTWQVHARIEMCNQRI